MTILYINEFGSNPNPRYEQILLLFERYNYNVELITWNKRNRKERIQGWVTLVRSISTIIKADLVYTRNLYVLLFLILFKKNEKIIFEFHGLLYEEMRFSNQGYFCDLIEFIERLALSRVQKMIFVNNYQRELFHHDLKFAVIPNCIDIELIDKCRSPDEQNRIGFMGNWERWIQISDLLNLSDVYTVEIVGEGVNYDKLRDLYPIVNWNGYLPRRLAHAKMKDCFCVISPWSDDPIFKQKSARKTFEYMAIGVPIVVSDVPGKEEFLIDGHNCVSYTLGSRSSLVEAIESLRDNHFRNRIINNAQKTALNYTWQNQNLGSLLS